MPRPRLLTMLSVPTLVLACASTPSAPPPRRGSRFVLVPLSARLRQRPRDDSAAVQFRPGGPSPEVAAFRRVRARGEWVLVETPSRPERQCHASLELPEGLRLRFWVRATELAPALVRGVARSGGDGSELHARPGLRVVPDGELAQLWLGAGAQVTVAIEPREVGVAFAEPRPTAAEDAGERLVGGVSVPFLDGGQLVTTRGSAPVYVTERRASQGSHLARVETACAALTVRVQPNQVVPVMSIEVEDRGAPTREASDTTVIQAGARLRWPEGGIAGFAAADVEVGPASRRVDGMPCHSVPLAVRGAEGLRPVRVELCVEQPPEE